MTNEKLKKLQKDSQEAYEIYTKHLSTDPANGSMVSFQLTASLLVVACEIARRLPPALDDEE